MSAEPGILPKPIAFGKYYLLERINVGGMAEVYKAKAFGVEGFERLLAVKKILSSIAEDESFINMFIDEAKIAVKLNHPNIAQVFELGKADEAYFIAMEYISGKDLKTIFERARRIGEKVDIPRVCYVMMKVCEGLAYAHHKKDSQGNEINIVHRDVSPQNILISYEGEVKIIDFGIAKAQGKTSQTQVGILKGKFSYMSPEQVRGLHVDHRSDIFSLGIVLYEMLTLERLFLGESDFDTLEKIRKVEMSPPSLYNPHIPKELEDIVLKALAKSPDDRYQSSYDLAEALEQFMRNQGFYYTNKDLAASMKQAFSADIEFENKKLEYYRGLNLKPIDQQQPRQAAAAKPAGGGLSWDDEEMETQIFDRASGVEEIGESDIVYAEEVDEGIGGNDPTIEYDRWEVQNKIDELAFDDPRPDEPGRRRSSTAQVSVPEQQRPAQDTVQGPVPMGGRSERNSALIIAIVAAAVVILGLGGYLAYHQFVAAPGPPSIAFATEPSDVSIFINGNEIHDGTTPFTQQLEPGPTEIRIEREGFEPFVKSLELEPGREYELTHTLEPISADRNGIFVKTDPPGAKVTIDGTAASDVTPVTVKKLEPGKHTVSVELADYFTAEEQVEVTAGEVAELSVDLRPKVVDLTVRSEPSRAEFTLYDKESGDRVKRGRTPETIEKLDASKTYRVVVERSGYEDWEQTFEPGTDPAPALEAELEREERRPVAQNTRGGSQASQGSSGTGSQASPTSQGGSQPDPKPEPKPKPDPKPEPKAEPSGTGTLSIASRPAARVYINGKDTGRYTPILNFKIKAGKHKIALVNEDFGLNKTYYVNLKAGESKRVINK